MAQEQARRAQAIKYGDVFETSGELADMPISPRAAAAMLSAETTAFGKTLKDGPASLMHSAASKNLQAGLVAPDDASGVVPADQTDAAAIAAAELRATHTNMDCVGDAARAAATLNEHMAPDENKITVAEIIGEVKGKLSDDKPVEIRDAEWVAAAELRQDEERVVAGGVAETVAMAAMLNEP